MGLTIEMKPDGNYLWHSAAQKALFVDELIAASGSGMRALTTETTPVDAPVLSAGSASDLRRQPDPSPCRRRARADGDRRATARDRAGKNPSRRIAHEGRREELPERRDGTFRRDTGRAGRD